VWKHEASYIWAKEAPLLYIKPTTFMNESGRAVRAAADYYKVPAERIIIIQDDSDMELGTFKLRQGGGTGGHNGVASVVSEMPESEKIWRLKIGIRRQADEGVPREKALDIVLRTIGKQDTEILYGVFAEAEKSLLNVIENEMP